MGRREPGGQRRHGDVRLGLNGGDQKPAIRLQLAAAPWPALTRRRDRAGPLITLLNPNRRRRRDLKLRRNRAPTVTPFNPANQP